MDPAIVVPVASLLVTALTAIGVPYLTFAHNRKLERVRQLVAERGRLYVDVLAEAFAEKNWLEDFVSTKVHGPPDQYTRPLPDTRLSDADRAKLGARIGVFAEPSVLKAWGRFNAAGAPYMVTAKTEGDLIRFRMDMAAAMEDLETAIRKAMVD